MYKRIRRKKKANKSDSFALTAFCSVLFYSIFYFLSFPSLCLVLFTFCPDLCFYFIFICFVSSFPPYFDPCWLFFSLYYYYCYLHDIHPFSMLSLVREWCGWLEGEKSNLKSEKKNIDYHLFLLHALKHMILNLMNLKYFNDISRWNSGIHKFMK